MNIDLLPFSAFALESSGPATQALADSHTLTLKGALMPVDSSYEPAMNGSIEIQALAMGVDYLWRAAVVQAEGTGLTITF